MNKGSYILVVDDDADLRQNMADVLEDEGYATRVAGSGREALSILKKTPQIPRLILLDLLMPDMNGWQFCHEQRADHRLIDVPVLVVTANRNLGPDPPGNDVLLKPFRLEEILQKVKRLAG
jgi:CheY-like chemotaxis protein